MERQVSVTVFTGIDGRLIFILAIIGGAQIVKWIDQTLSKSKK